MNQLTIFAYLKVQNPTSVMVLIFLGIFCLLSLILGFIALIKQKIYVDQDNNSITHIELPILGKLSTNYPALIFIFFSFGSIYLLYQYAIKIEFKDKNYEWRIQGSINLVDSETGDAVNNLYDLSKFTVRSVPPSENIGSKGHFDYKHRFRYFNSPESGLNSLIISSSEYRIMESVKLGRELSKYNEGLGSLIDTSKVEEAYGEISLKPIEIIVRKP